MFAVIIPVYNRKTQVLDAIKSVLEQTIKDYELIVIDDGSTDDLSDVQACLEQCGSKYIKTKNLGPAHARNIGVESSNASYLAFLDSDDLWLPEKLEAQKAYIAANPGIRISQCNEIWFRNGKRVNKKSYHVMPEGEIFNKCVERCLISPSSVVMERDLFEEFGGFDEDLFVCEDYELWLRITAKYPVGLIKQDLLIKYGGHADQLSRSQMAIDRFRVYALLKLLLNEDLSLEQIKMVEGEIKIKTEVLLKGAMKRKSENKRLYERILNGEFLQSELKNLICSC